MSHNGRPDAEKSLQLVKEKRIERFSEKSLVDFFLVKGKDSDYLVIYPNFCTCEQFILRNLKSVDNVCYHILAVKMARGKIKKTTDRDWIKLLLKKH